MMQSLFVLFIKQNKKEVFKKGFKQSQREKLTGEVETLGLQLAREEKLLETMNFEEFEEN